MGDREPPGGRPTPPRIPGAGGAGRGPGGAGGPPEGQTVSRIVSPRGQTLMELWELGREDERMTIRGRLMGRFPSLMYASPRESGKMLGFLLRPAVVGYILSFPFLWLAETLRSDVDAERRRRAMDALDVLAAAAIGALVFAALGYMATSAVEVGTGLLVVGVAQLVVASVVGSSGGVLGAVSAAIGFQLVVLGIADGGLILAPLAGVPAFAAYAVLGPWADGRGLRSGRTLIWSVAAGGAISGSYLLLEIRNVLGTAGAPTAAVLALAFFAVFHAERYAYGETWARWGTVPFAVFASLVAVAGAPLSGDARAMAVVALGAAVVGVGLLLASMRVVSFVVGLTVAVAGSGMLWTAGLEGPAAASAAVVGAVGWGAVRRLDLTGWSWAFGALAAAGVAGGALVGGSDPLWALAVSGGLVAGGIVGGGTEGAAGRIVPLYGAGVVLGALGSPDGPLGNGTLLAVVTGAVLLGILAPAGGRLLGHGTASGPEAAAVALVLVGVRAAAGWAPLDVVAAAALAGAAAAAIGRLVGWEGALTLLGVAAPVGVASLAVLADLGPIAAPAVAIAAMPLARASLGAVGGGSAGAVGTAATALVSGPWWPLAVGGWAAVVGAQRSRARVWRLLLLAATGAAVGAAVVAPGLVPAAGLLGAGAGVFLAPVRWRRGWGTALLSGAGLAAVLPEVGGASAFAVAAGPAALGLAVAGPARRWAAVEGAAAAALVALVWSSVAQGASAAGIGAFAVVAVLGAISARARAAAEPADPEGADAPVLDGREGFGAAADFVWITVAVAGAVAHVAGPLGADAASGAAAALGIGAVLLAGALPSESVGPRLGLRIGGAVVAQGLALAWVVADADGAVAIAAAGPLVWGALAVVDPRRSYVPAATFGVGVWAVAVMAGFPTHLPRWVELGALAVGGGLAASAAAWTEGRLDRGVARASASVGRTAARGLGGGVAALGALGAAGVVLLAAAVLDPLVRAGVEDLVFRLGRWFGSFGLP